MGARDGDRVRAVRARTERRTPLGFSDWWEVGNKEEGGVKAGSWSALIAGGQGGGSTGGVGSMRGDI